MEIKKKQFGEVKNLDLRLLQPTPGSYAMRYRSGERIVLFSGEGQMINIVAENCGCGPNFICLEFLPEQTQELPADGWFFDDKSLRVPFMTQIDLAKTKDVYDSLYELQINDFPGHMSGLINKFVKAATFPQAEELKSRLGVLAEAAQLRQNESTELPVIGLVGFGAGLFSEGDSALCGMLLTARFFASGRRFNLNWLKLLAVEVRRFFHRTGPYGRNWLSNALQGRVTQSQKSFFHAMSRDYESASEVAVKHLADDSIINGLSFLAGVSTALNMIQTDAFETTQSRQKPL